MTAPLIWSSTGQLVGEFYATRELPIDGDSLARTPGCAAGQLWQRIGGPKAPTEWERQVARSEMAIPRGWEGLKVGPESGLSDLEVDALRRSGQLADG